MKKSDLAQTAVVVCTGMATNGFVLTANTQKKIKHKNKRGLTARSALSLCSFLTHCLNAYNTTADYPFDADFETAVLRHHSDRKWYAIVMRVSRRKFGFDSDEVIDVVNLKLPLEMFGSFGAVDGVYPAYHMNKLHWISVLLPDMQADAKKEIDALNVQLKHVTLYLNELKICAYATCCEEQLDKFIENTYRYEV